MAVRSTPVGAFVDTTSALSAATTNGGPGGCIGYSALQANTTGTTTLENAIVLSAVPVNTGRLIRITANGTMRATSPSGLQVQILEDGTALARRNFSAYTSAVDVEFTIVALSHAPSNGTHTYTLVDGVSGAGGATVNILASATTTCWLIVEDLGPDF